MMESATLTPTVQTDDGTGPANEMSQVSGWIDDAALDQLVLDLLPKAAGEALTPGRLEDAMGAKLKAEGLTRVITFSDVRRAIWRLVGRSLVEFTNDWRVYRHSV